MKGDEISMLSPYDRRTEAVRTRIMGKMKDYFPNQIYKSAEGNFYFFINNKGFFHILRPCRVNLNGEFSHVAISDYLLTKDNMLKETSCYGRFDNAEEVMQHLEMQTL